MASLVRPWAIILAAGSGSRMSTATHNIPKQFFSYQGFPLYWHSACALCACPSLAGLIFVFPEAFLAQEKERLIQLDKQHPLGLPWQAISGGILRQDSVYCGIKALPSECTYVLVHDAARPFVSPTLLQRLCIALQDGHRGVIPAIPVTDTIKRVCGSTVQSTLPRSELVAVQTPQAFFLTDLKASHEQCKKNGWQVTDDASLLEACDIPVHIVDGDINNHKITHPEDLTMLEEKPHNTPLYCTALGYDVHKFGSGRPLKLGGVSILNSPEVIAHSDGDVLLHALMDAMLGVASLGDIGQHFPDSSSDFDNISSAVLLARVQDMLLAKQVQIVHVDVTIITQTPKIAPYREAIRRNIARLLKLDTCFVNVKATTEEGLGFTGAKEGIKALAQVSALRPAIPNYGV